MMFRLLCAVLLVVIDFAAIPVSAQVMPSVSASDAAQIPTATGSGDSSLPIISPDGRYVLFASTAGNLALTTSNTPFAPRPLSALNVFLRDRTNGTTALVSANFAGNASGNDDSLPMGVSTNGRYAVFESTATDLVPGDTNGVSDVFVRDLVLGTTVLVSVGIDGGVGDGASRSPVMTPDGRYVAFVSASTNLVASDTNGITDVFVRDLQLGVTVMASVGSAAISGSGTSDFPDITPDGRYVAFYSTAANLAAGPLNSRDLYVRDLVGGSTFWVSSGAKAAAVSVLAASPILCYNHAISDDGQFIAYEASAASSASSGLILRYGVAGGLTDIVHTNAAVEAVPGGTDFRTLDISPDGQRIVFVANTNGTTGTTTCILLWNAATGAASLVSGNMSGSVVTNALCDWPSMDATGRYVAFSSTAANLVTNTLAAGSHLFVRDLVAGATKLLDANTNGAGSVVSLWTAPCLSADGRFVAFQSDDPSLLSDDRNRGSDVVVRDLVTGALELISARDPQLPSFTLNGRSIISPNGASSDGRYVAFASDADNLTANDTNGWRDVFVRDQSNSITLLVSSATNGFAGDGMSFEPALSADGRYVAFTSQADNLVAGDNNRSSDIFVRDLQAGTTTLVSVKSGGGGPANTNSYSPVIGSGGRYVLFRSKANNLTAGAFSGTDNLFVRDLQSATNAALTTAGLTAAAMTPDGHFVVYLDGTSKLYKRDNILGKNVYTNSTAGITKAAISPDGTRIAYWTSTPRLFVTNLGAGTSWTVVSNTPSARPGLRFSADNRFLTYATGGANNQVYLYDFVANTNLLVSHAYAATTNGAGSSDSPDISPDGRFVAFRSSAANLVSGDTNGMSDIFLFDRQTGANTLLSASLFGSYSANNRSLLPVFSGDGQTLLFQTWASDLAGQDFNQLSDVVAYSLFASGSIPMFSAAILRGAPGQGPWITWAAISNRTYHVQYKTDLGDAWQELGGSVTIVGNQGSCQDLVPSPTGRFYRVVSP